MGKVTRKELELKLGELWLENYDLKQQVLDLELELEEERERCTALARSLADRAQKRSNPFAWS
jgi:hypothetical protein